MQNECGGEEEWPNFTVCGLHIREIVWLVPAIFAVSISKTEKEKEGNVALSEAMPLMSHVTS